MPYKFVVNVASRAFRDAPPAIINAVTLLTKHAEDVVEGGHLQPFNELLALGYFQDMSIDVSVE